MHVIDLGAQQRALPGGELDPSRRPDGVHWSADAAPDVVSWLMPQLQELVRQGPTLPTPTTVPG